MADDRLYCKNDGILVRRVPTSNVIIGKKEKKQPVQYVHTSSRSATGASTCSMRILTADDVESLIEASE